MSKQLGLTVKKNEDFSEWYSQIVLKAELADYSRAKGFIAVRPTGYAIWELIQDHFDAEIKKTGHMNAYMPVLIPESLLSLEEEHFKGFTPEVFWVTHAGNNQLQERMAVRPTSETIAYASYANWVRSWRDLPLLLNFWNSALRAEIKSTKPFIRTSEFLWQEGHTVHASYDEAETEVTYILNIYKRLMENLLAIPVFTGKKTSKEKFVGALHTYTLESIMPDGKVIQMGTSHNLGQNFSKAFEIRFLGTDKQEHYAWQTSWGISWRLLGALIMVHGDDKGLILPPNVAPTQVVVVPIYYSTEDRTEVNGAVDKMAKMLRRAKIRVKVDNREEYTPGWKFNEYELKGIPLRIEIGPRDLREKKVTMVRRDTGARTAVEAGAVLREVKRQLKDIQNNLFLKADAFSRSMLVSVDSYGEMKERLDKVGGMVIAGWCGDQKCEDKVKEETGADIRLLKEGKEPPATCIICSNTAKSTAYYGRAY